MIYSTRFCIVNRLRHYLILSLYHGLYESRSHERKSSFLNLIVQALPYSADTKGLPSKPFGSGLLLSFHGVAGGDTFCDSKIQNARGMTQLEKNGIRRLARAKGPNLVCYFVGLLASTRWRAC